MQACRWFVALSALALLALAAHPTSAATVSWSAAVNGNWSDGTKWSSNPNPPQPGDDVVINAVGTYTVTLDTDVVVNSLTLGTAGTGNAQTLQTNNRNLTLNGANPSTVLQTGILMQSGGTLGGAGNVTVAGTYRWTAGMLTGAGSFIVNGTLTFTGGSSKALNGRTLVSNGSAAIQSGGSVNLSNGAVLRNGAAATFDVQVDSFVGVSGSPTTETFDNDGTLTKSGGAATSTFDVFMDVSGPVNANVGSLAFSRGGTWTGPLNVATFLRFSGGTHGLSGVGISGPGTTQITGGTVNTNGAVTVAAMSTLAHSATLGGGGALTVNGAFLWTAGSVTGSGPLTVNGTLTFDSGSSKTLNGRTIVSNNSTILKGGSVNLANGAVFRNALGATFDVQVDAFMGIAGMQTTETFDNDGTLTKSGGMATSTFDVPMEVTGPVNANTGSLAFSRGGTWTGPLNVATFLRFNGGTHGLSGVAISGPGTTQITGGTVNTNGAVSVAAMSTLSSSATLGGNGALMVNGAFLWTAGSVTGSGAFTVNGTLTFDSGSGKTLNGRTIVSNNSAVFKGGSFTLSNGAVFRNAMASTFDMQVDGFVGISGTQTTETFDNDGTLTKSGGIGTSTFDVPMDVTGPVNANTGTLAFIRGGTWTGPLNVAATLRFSGGTHGLSGVAISGGGLCQVTGGTMNSNGAVTVAAKTTLTNTATIGGNGPLTVNGAFSWTAGTVTGAGPFTVNGSLNLDASGKSLNGRTVVSNGSAVWKGGAVTLSNGAVLRNGASGSFDLQNDLFMGLSGAQSTETFDNDGSFTKSGGVGMATIDVPATNSGTVQIQSGTLRFSRGAYVQTAGATILNGGHLNVQVSADIQGGSLRGTGTVTGNVINSGSVAPGLSPGRLMITGTYTQTASGALDIEIGGLTPETQFDQIAVGGASSLNGALNVTLIGGFSPVQGNQFLVLDGATGGNFSSTSLPPLPGGLMWQVNVGSVLLSIGGTGPTLTPSQTPPSTATATRTHSGTVTPIPAATLTRTVTSSPQPGTATPVSTGTATPTSTATPTLTATATRTNTGFLAPGTLSPTRTPTTTRTVTGLPTSTAAPPATATDSSTPTSTSTATFTPFASPTSTGTSTATFTPSVTPTVTPTALLSFQGRLFQPGPTGMIGNRGLVPVPGQLVELFTCERPSECFTRPGPVRASAVTDAEGRFRLTITADILTRRLFILLRVVIDGRTVRFLLTPRTLGVIAVVQRSGGGAQETPELTLDPISEAAVRLLEDAGANDFGEEAIDALIDAVDTANADSAFAGLTLGDANDLAATTAANDPAVQMALEDLRSTPTPTPLACAGDCDGDGGVTVDDLVIGVLIRRGTPASCLAFEADGVQGLSMTELVGGITRALVGCVE